MHKHASTNRFYRLVWSHVHSCWVAVAEGARGRGKSASRKLTAALLGTALAGAALAAPPGPAGFALAPKALPTAPAAGALPTGAQVVAGQASVTQAANQMTVHQGSDKAILNWQSFDIGANAGVRFVQPNANAVALNRVLGNDPSRIYGQLSANGKVFLVNGSGVLFGASARVDVGGLIASSLALPDGDFLAGRYTFSGSANAGAVRNEGSIRTRDGGYAVLLGPSVSNAGSIVAPNGSVALGAGEQVGVDLRGDGLITLRVDRGAVNALAGNSGMLQADGGRVELSAKGADALARATVNNTGVVQARGLVADGGIIRLVGDGDVQAGALDASSRNGKGGAVAVEGRFVMLDGAIDASGARGGSVDVNAAGTLSTAAATNAVGRAGDGGTVSYRSAATVVASTSASVDASGAAKGGSIGVQGEGGVLSSGSYSARSANGIGGRIDVSGSDVRLLGAQLDATGNTQGGLVRVGGAFQGGAMRADAPDLARFVTRWGQTGNIANATSTFVGDGTAIKVGATGRAGQGGTAVVWSDRQTTMLGSIDARGAGAAGTVEISSKDELRHVGLERIALGSGGQLLLDPKNITIGSGGGAGQWTYQAIMGKAYSGGGGSDPGTLEQYDGFGMSVALNAAGNRMAVGSPYDDGASGTNYESGAVHLFSFTDANFSGASLQGTIGVGYSGGKNFNVALSDGAQFGYSVALNADATRLAVGAPNDGNGSVRLFSFADNQFSAPTLTHTIGFDYGSANLQNAAGLGSAVALNAVGDRLAIGAYFDSGDGSCGACGAVYLYNNAIASPTFAKAIGAGYGANVALPLDAQFGTSVAFDGSGDKLAVGAYGVDNARGAVYLFKDAFGATTQVATIGNGKDVNVPLVDGEGFSSVALNSAGTRLAVGASGSGNTGSVRIFDFADGQFGSPTVSAILGSGNNQGVGAEANLETGEWFGYSVAMNGAGNRLLVGSPLSDGNLSDNAGYGTVRAFSLGLGNIGFGSNAGANVTVDASTLAAALDGGTSITLQANNDITLEAGNAIAIADGSGNGSLTLQAGRSINLNSSITTGNADLTLVANETTANGVVNAYRDAGAAVITTASGTTINAGSGRVNMTIANGAGKTNSGSGAITIGGNLLAGNVSLKNQGTTANSNVVIGATGGIVGTGNGLIEIVTPDAFLNNAGGAGINPGAGRYLVYSHNPTNSLEGLTGYKKHYSQMYTGSAPAYASSGNWFLYAITPTLNVSAATTSKVYDGTAVVPALGIAGVSGLIDGDTQSVLSGALAVTGATRNVGAYAIDSSALATELGYAISYTGPAFTITPRVLNATISGVNKTYDGNNIAAVNFSDDRIAGDALSYDSVARFDSKNAGSGKTVNVTGITLSGGDAANYTLAANSGTTNANIFQRVLNASAIGLNKTYDGGSSANVVLGDDRMGGDQLTLTADSASFADKNAGNGKAVTVTGIALEGADALNYTLASTSVGTSANINRRTLTASVAGQDKVYDGGTAATVIFGDNRIAGDQLNVSGSASFADRNAGNGKTVSIGGIALDGLDAANYTLASTTATTSANLTKRALNASATGVNKTYDGNTNATVVFSDDRIAGDLLDYSASASFADKMAGSGKGITVTGIALGGQDAGNYELASATAAAQADIARRALAVTASGSGKTYDGNTSATVTLADDRLSGDVLNVTGNASFADKNAGTGKTIHVTGLALDGQDAVNYELASTATTASADIAKRTLNATVSVLDKVYDGTTTAQFGMQDDRVAGDVLAVSAASASFADKHVGSNKAVSVSGVSLAGQDAGNYELSASVGSTTASITPRTLNVSATGIDKVYDGGTLANVVLGDDRVAGDLLSVTNAGAAFSDKNAGSGKAVSVTGIAFDGADAANYVLASTSTGASAAITPRTLHVSATGVDKVYDGGTLAGVVLGDDRLGNDQLGVAANARFADKNVGSGKAVRVDGLALSGLDAGNYQLADATLATSAAITPKALVASLNGSVTKVYDGNTGVGLAAGQVQLGGFVGGEAALVGALNAKFDSANVLQAQGVQAQLPGAAVAAADGTLLSNYVLPTSVNGAGSITPKALTVVGMRANDKVYDGTTNASVASIGALEGLVNGESLQLGGPASVRFDTRGAGTGKLVTASGYQLADGANGLASNYVLSGPATSNAGTITQATLTVKANNASRAAGLGNPVFGYSVSGLVNGDSPAILPEFVTASSATPQSTPGEYAITVNSNATLNDYKLAFVDGVLKVTGAPAELTRAIRATIAPALPIEVTGGTGTVAQQQNEQQQRELPRVEEVSNPASPARVPGQAVGGTVVTLSGGTEVLTRNGGVRSAQ